MGFNGLKPALTPALSPEERENTFPRFDNLQALDLTRFRGSRREGEISPRPSPPLFVEERGTNQRVRIVRTGMMASYALSRPAESGRCWHEPLKLSGASGFSARARKTMPGAGALPGSGTPFRVLKLWLRMTQGRLAGPPALG